MGSGRVFGALALVLAAGCGDGEPTTAAPTKPPVMTTKPCSGANGCAGTQVCYDDRCGPCSCPPETRACVGKGGCKGSQTCLDGNCGSCTCDAPPATWSSTFQGKPLDMQVAPDG